MVNIGEQVKNLRIGKGYSQEELANLSGLSIRTIQRIEKGETIPRGHTLHRLSEVLEVEVSELVAQEERIAAAPKSSVRPIYLLVLIGLVVPLGNVIGPLIGWSIYKKESEVADVVGKNVILTQLIYSLVTSALILYAVFTKLDQHQGYVFEWLIGLGFVLAVINYSLVLYAGIQSEGKRKMYVPFYKMAYV
ncbi:helix-turn-helix domain-containing protein [Myroides sp. DF42-4-2]|uniref:helix-turn-helix domain-containing protein n=1 Tax=unclassified Myroides TaxID=2642485 RepID=UPI002578D489|nr:helix-turn-helix domain-containing protein [Myroides sp. DF42-4-2]MDM1407369.1 helix-turn-helix domain-containing protein [Myroides sp. DF42-4-2]